MNKGFQVGWWLSIITVVVMNAAVFVLSNLLDIKNEYLLTLIGELTLLLPIFLGLLYAKKHHIGVKEALGIKKFSPAILPFAIILTIGAQYFIAYFTMPVQTVLLVLYGIETTTSQMSVPQTLPDIILAVIAICIVGPIMEELLTRGIVMKLFERYGFTTCLISEALVFTVLHFDMRSIIPIFFLGIIMGIFRLSTGSVLITAVMHMVNNSLSLFQLYLNSVGKTDVVMMVSWMGALVFPFALYICFVTLKKHHDFSNISFKYEKTGFSLAALICFCLFFITGIILFLQRLINGECLLDLYRLLGITSF